MPRAAAAPAKTKPPVRSSTTDELFGTLTQAQKRLAMLTKQAEKTVLQLQAAQRGADELPECEAAPPDQRGDGTRTIKLMADLAAVAKEQVDLFQNAAEGVADKPLRTAFEEAREIAHRHQLALEQRAKQLQGELSGGRGLFGQLVSRVMDVLQKPSDDADRSLHFLLRGVAATEMAAGLYIGLRAAATTLGDESTAALAAAHYGHERDRGDRFRSHINQLVTSMARKVPASG